MAEERARKHRQAKRKRPAAAQPKDGTARLAELRKGVAQQERQLQRARAEQQRAALAAKFGLHLPRGRAVKKGPSPSRSDYAEGSSTSILVNTLLLSHAMCLWFKLLEGHNFEHSTCIRAKISSPGLLSCACKEHLPYVASLLPAVSMSCLRATPMRRQ